MAAQRYQSVDSLRGCAIVLMVLYHLCFDLNLFHVIKLDFYHDPFWLGGRVFIVSLFLLLVGISLTLSVRRGLDSPAFRQAFGRRLAWLSICAMLISLTSYLMTPSRWIFFGILHFIAVASVLSLLFVRRPGFGLIVGILLIGLGIFSSFPLFDRPALQWLGLMTHKPYTDDYVPLVPWFGVVLLGQYIGFRWFGDAAPAVLVRHYDNRVVAALSWAGRYSLLIYMLHQPILFGILMLLVG